LIFLGTLAAAAGRRWVRFAGSTIEDSMRKTQAMTLIFGAVFAGVAY